MLSEIISYLDRKLDDLDNNSIEEITYKVIRDELTPIYGNEEISQLKEEIKVYLRDYLINRLNSKNKKRKSEGSDKITNESDKDKGNNHKQEEQQEEEGEEDEDSNEGEEDDSNGSEEEEEEEEDSDSSDDIPEIQNLPEEWKKLFGEICWVKGQKSFPW